MSYNAVYSPGKDEEVDAIQLKADKKDTKDDADDDTHSLFNGAGKDKIPKSRSQVQVAVRRRQVAVSIAALFLLLILTMVVLLSVFYHRSHNKKSIVSTTRDASAVRSFSFQDMMDPIFEPITGFGVSFFIYIHFCRCVCFWH